MARRRFLGKRSHDPATRSSARLAQGHAEPADQELALYWDAQFAQTLETWGEGNAWNEIQLLMVNCKGRILDIACGTGRVMQILSNFDGLELYGCDISDYLIRDAGYRGFSPGRLIVCDATRTPYPDDYFDYAYSIGSLEHFTQDGIQKFISECHRIARGTAFHQIPVSRSREDEGWITPCQAYYNNSVEWWLAKFKATYPTVHVLDSVWQDQLSVGKWFVCMKV